MENEEGKKRKRLGCWLLLLLVAWGGVSLYFLLDAALSHSEAMKAQVPWKSAGAFVLMVLLPMGWMWFRPAKQPDSGGRENP